MERVAESSWTTRTVLNDWAVKETEVFMLQPSWGAVVSMSMSIVLKPLPISSLRIFFISFTLLSAAIIDSLPPIAAGFILFFWKTELKILFKSEESLSKP